MQGEKRPVADLLILMLAGTVCLSVIGSTAAVLIVEVRDPLADTRGITDVLLNAMSVLVSVIAGFVAGRLTPHR